MSISSSPSALATPSVRSSSAVVAAQGSPSPNGLESLTPEDFELVYQATGRRVTKDSPTAPAFAGIIASQRRTGAIPDGQPISASWLRDLADTARRTSGDESLAQQADLALEYLVKGRVAGRQISL